MNKAQEPIAAPNYPVDCTSSRAAPVLDVICAGYFVLNTAVLAGAKTCDSAAPGEACVASGTKSGGMLLSAGLALLCGGSAGSGFGNASKCEQVKNFNALCITGDEASCKKLNPAWVPPMKFPAQASTAPAGAVPAAAVVPAAADPASAAPAAAGPASPAVPTAGCSRDTDCKGDRICVQGACAEPAPKAPPAR